MTELLLYISETCLTKNATRSYVVTFATANVSREIFPTKTIGKKSRAQKVKTRRNSPKSSAFVNRQTDHFEHILQTIPVFYKTKTMAIIESFDFCHLHSPFKPNKCRTEFTKTRRCLTICQRTLMWFVRFCTGGLFCSGLSGIHAKYSSRFPFSMG